MCAQQLSLTPKTLPIRKISPRIISNANLAVPPYTQENWQHLVNIVMKLVQDKQIKESVVTDLTARMHNLETVLDNGMSTQLHFMELYRLMM